MTRFQENIVNWIVTRVLDWFEKKNRKINKARIERVIQKIKQVLVILEKKLNDA